MHVKVDVIQTDVTRFISIILLLWSFISTSSTLHLIQYQGGPVLLKELASWKRDSFFFLEEEGRRLSNMQKRSKQKYEIEGFVLKCSVDFIFNLNSLGG